MCSLQPELVSSIQVMSAELCAAPITKPCVVATVVGAPAGIANAAMTASSRNMRPTSARRPARCQARAARARAARTAADSVAMSYAP